jgi:hypothetical protein
MYQPQTGASIGLGTEFRSEKIPRNRLGTVSVIPRKKVLIPRYSEFRGRANSEARNGTKERSGIPRKNEVLRNRLNIEQNDFNQGGGNQFLTVFFGFFHVCTVLYSTLLHLPPLRFHCVGGCWDRTQDRCDLGIGCKTL